ncbi:hypothetical protein LguiA_033069 [Lonicera macranthoides]
MVQFGSGWVGSALAHPKSEPNLFDFFVFGAIFNGLVWMFGFQIRYNTPTQNTNNYKTKAILLKN